jgi:hypothetical protein
MNKKAIGTLIIMNALFIIMIILAAIYVISIPLKMDSFCKGSGFEYVEYSKPVRNNYLLCCKNIYENNVAVNETCQAILYRK